MYNRLVNFLALVLISFPLYSMDHRSSLTQNRNETITVDLASTGQDHGNMQAQALPLPENRDEFCLSTWNVLHRNPYKKYRKNFQFILEEENRNKLMKSTISQMIKNADILCFQEFDCEKGNDKRLFDEIKINKKDMELILPVSPEKKSFIMSLFAKSGYMSVATAFDKTKFELVGSPIFKFIKKDDSLHNLLFIKLKSKKTKLTYGIFNVHLPFTSNDFDAVENLADVIKEILLEVKGKKEDFDIDNYIICGDFNLDSYNNSSKAEEIKIKIHRWLFEVHDIFENDPGRVTAIGSDKAAYRRFDYIFYASKFDKGLFSNGPGTYPALPQDINKLVRHDQGSLKYEFSSDHAVVFTNFIAFKRDEVKKFRIAEENEQIYTNSFWPINKTILGAVAVLGLTAMFLCRGGSVGHSLK